MAYSALIGGALYSGERLGAAPYFQAHQVKGYEKLQCEKPVHSICDWSVDHLVMMTSAGQESTSENIYEEKKRRDHA